MPPQAKVSSKCPRANTRQRIPSDWARMQASLILFQELRIANGVYIFPLIHSNSVWFSTAKLFMARFWRISCLGLHCRFSTYSMAVFSFLSSLKLLLFLFTGEITWFQESQHAIQFSSRFKLHLLPFLNCIWDLLSKYCAFFSEEVKHGCLRANLSKNVPSDVLIKQQ